MKKFLAIVLAGLVSSSCSQYEPKSRWREIDELRRRVELLEQQFSNNETVLNALSAQVDTLANLINALQQADLTFTETDNGLQASLASLQASLNALQLAQNEVVADLAQLQTNENITEFVDPCGDGSGFDEVLVRTSSGKLVAYFETGSKRFLSVLSPGSYRTTDNQGCYFTVNSSGQIINEHL